MVRLVNCPIEPQFLQNSPVIERFNHLLKAVVPHEDVEIDYYYTKDNLSSYLEFRLQGNIVARQSAAIDNELSIMKDCIKLLESAHIL